MAPIPNLSINPFIFSAFFPRVAVFEISAAYVGVILPRALSMAAPMPSYSAEKVAICYTVYYQINNLCKIPVSNFMNNNLRITR